MDYPVWPSRRSLEKLREGIIQFASDAETRTDRLFTNIVRINPDIPIYSANIGRLKVFLKQNYTGLGRGNFEHEIAISSQVNTLRDICPNFNLALVQITSPNLSNDPRTDSRVLLTEYTPGPTIQEFLRTQPPFLEVFSLFLQAILAMEIAHKALGLVHGDLLASNIIGRELLRKMVVKYEDIWIETSRIPVIYDFDRSVCDSSKDLRADIYTLLFSSFRDYPKEFQTLLNWYEVKFHTGVKHRQIIDEQSPNLKLHSGKDLLNFGVEHFGFIPMDKGGPVLEQEDILGLESDE
jgi:hypothetical protein